MGEIVQMAAITRCDRDQCRHRLWVTRMEGRPVDGSVYAASVPVQARVTRDGSSATVDSEELVPGDVCFCSDRRQMSSRAICG